MTGSTDAPTRVRKHFRRQADAFDDLYEDERRLQRLLRPGLFGRREFAVDAARGYTEPRVLDVGCGSGRIGEFVLDAGAGEYVGIDFAEPMVSLARRRLERFGERASLVCDDFLRARFDGRFDLVIALGLFDYLAEPRAFVERMRDVCAEGGCVVASFPAWTPLKGPLRKVRYEWVNDCPIYNYDRGQLERLFDHFERVEVTQPRRSGYLVRAYA